MEDTAIKEGFANLKTGTDYDNLYRSALARSQADWLVGINATRLYTCLAGTLLRVGRVQTPVLAMLCERAAQIDHFKKRLTGTSISPVRFRAAQSLSIE